MCRRFPRAGREERQVRSSYQIAAAFRKAALRNMNDEEGALRLADIDEYRELRKLGWLGVEPLLELLQDDDPMVRSAAIEALGPWSNDQRIIEPLLAALEHAPPYVRGCAASLLGETCDQRAHEPLRTLLQDRDESIHYVAARALRHFPGPQTVQALLSALLKEPDSHAQRHIAEELMKMGGYAELRTALDAGVALGVRLAAKTLAKTGGDGAFEHLVLLLRFGEAPQPKWPGLADALLDTSDASALRELLQALVESGDSRAVDILVSLLEHPHWFARTAAAGALRLTGDNRGMAAVVDLLHEDSEAVLRYRSFLPLDIAQDPAVEDTLIDMLAGGSEQARKFAAWQLVKTTNPCAVDPFVAALDAGLWSAARALGSFDDERAANALIRGLSSPDATITRHAILGLGRIKSAAAVQPLLELLGKDIDDQRDVIEALGKIGDERASQPLCELALNSDDARLRKAAAWALAQIRGAKAEEAMLELPRRGDLDAISGAYDFFSNTPPQGGEQELLRALAYCGSRVMAEAYSSSANAVLAEAGRDWLSQHPGAPGDRPL